MVKKNIAKNNAGALNIAIQNIKSFASKGARAESPGNVPTGHFKLDFALHFGILPDNKDLTQIEGYDPRKTLGLPLGRIVEIFGDEGSGKSSLCYRLVGNAQKMGLPCLWFDAEQSFSESLATINGVDLDNLYLADKGFTMEKIIDHIVDALESGIKVIIVDSVAGMVTAKRMESEAEDTLMALKARILSENLPKIATSAGKHGAIVVFINQVRDKPGMMFGPSETTTGGRSLPFFCSVRVKLTKRTAAGDAIFVKDENSDSGKRYIGHYSGLKIEKNRFAKPLVDEKGKRVTMDIPIYYEPVYPDIEEKAFDLGRQLKIIDLKKKMYIWKDLSADKGLFIITLKTDRSKLVNLVDEIKKTAATEDVVLPPEIIAFNPDVIVERAEPTIADTEEDSGVSKIDLGDVDDDLVEEDENEEKSA